MDDKQKQLVFLAESVSIAEADKLDPLFLTVTVKLCDSALNANREGVTRRFIEDVVNRQEDHQGLPFYADVKTLLNGDYENLSHLYDKVRRKFGTNMVGSIMEFYTEEQDDVLSLFGKIRIPKRDRDIVYRLVDLYEMGHFAVSVELSYDPREIVLQDGGKFIDVSENSSLTGLCLVWRPACDTAYALDMVAEENADGSSVIVADSEERAERGETSPMEDGKKLTAEVTEQEVQETAVAQTETTETVAETEDQQTAIAEGEGASEGGEGASESGGEGASESGAGASEGGSGASESGAGASEGGSGSGSGAGDDAGNDALINDPDDEQRQAVAETEEANAEVIEHSVDTHESVEECPYTGKPVHVIEYHERIIETLEDAGNLIAELDNKIAELEEIKGKYDAIIAEQEERAIAEKREHLRAFAEKQGLNMNDVAVAKAIEKLDYQKVTELSMAEDKDPVIEAPVKPAITLASFVEMEVSNDTYGGLLNRKNK